MDFRVFKSNDGRIVVQSECNDFIASFKHGEWVNDMVFEPMEMQELPQVEDAAEAKVIVSEARKALDRW